jgi:hypothetical protein
VFTTLVNIAATLWRQSLGCTDARARLTSLMKSLMAASVTALCGNLKR